MAVSSYSVQDSYLQLLVPDLFRLQFGAKAPATLAKYRACSLRWRSWALSKSCISVIPAEPLHVALFLADPSKAATENFLGFSSLEDEAYSIASVHKLTGFQISPTDHSFINSALEGARRSLAKPIRPKEPFFFRASSECCDALYNE